MASAAYQVITEWSYKLPIAIVEDGSDIWWMGSYTGYITNRDVPAAHQYMLIIYKSKKGLWEYNDVILYVVWKFHVSMVKETNLSCVLYVDQYQKTIWAMNWSFAWFFKPWET